VHVNSRQIELHLKAHVNVGSVNGWRPPKCKSTIGNLIQPGTLGVGKFLELHTFFKSTRFLPEEPFPGREVRPFEKCMLEDTLNTTQCLNHISSVVIQVP
jgi:hypothetical protein